MALGSTPRPWEALHGPGKRSTTVFSLFAKTMATFCGKATKERNTREATTHAQRPLYPRSYKYTFPIFLTPNQDGAVIMAHRLSLPFPLENIHAVERVQEYDGGPPPTALSFIPLGLSINISLDFTISYHFYVLSL